MENKVAMNDLEKLIEIDNLYINPSIELISEHIIHRQFKYLVLHGKMLVVVLTGN